MPSKPPRNAGLAGALSLVAEGLFLLLGLAPALIVSYASLGLPQGGMLSWLPFLLAAFCLLLALSPARVRRLLCPAAAVLGAVLLWLMLPGEAPLARRVFYTVLTAACAALLPLFALSHAFPAVLIGAAVHIVCGFITGTLFKSEVLYQSARVLLPALSGIYLACMIFYLNSRQLNAECSVHGRKPSFQMRLGNGLLCSLFLGLIFLAAHYKAIEDAVSRFFQAIVGWIMALLAMLTPDTSAVNEGGAAGSGDMGFMEAGETSPFWIVMEYVLYAVLAAVVLFGLYKLLRLLPAVFKKLSARLRTLLERYMGVMSRDYSDETESLMDWGQVQHSAGEGLKSAMRRLTPRPRWSTLSNRERVRAAYASLIRRLSKYEPSQTAHEALAGQPPDRGALADLYDKARYSDHEITPDEAEQARRALSR